MTVSVMPRYAGVSVDAAYNPCAQISYQSAQMNNRNGNLSTRHHHRTYELTTSAPLVPRAHTGRHEGSGGRNSKVGPKLNVTEAPMYRDAAGK